MENQIETTIAVALFILCLSLIEIAYYTVSSVSDPEARKVRRRLRNMTRGGYKDEPIDILRKTNFFSGNPRLDWILSKIPFMNRLTRLASQANTEKTPLFYLLSSLLMFVLGYIFSSFITRKGFAAIPIAMLCGWIPIFYLRIKKKLRQDKFERQLPEALDLIARSLKAGHSFSAGMQMVAEEFEDPLGTEFERTLQEINFGVSVPDALKNLTYQVECQDLAFFVVSVILQRETGGNMAELIEGIAYLIRERFKLHGRIQVLASEGKLSAYVLVALPFFVISVMAFLNRNYVLILVVDPVGKALIAVTLFLMLVGILVIRKLIQIKV